MPAAVSIQLPRAHVYPENKAPRDGWQQRVIDRMAGVYRAVTTPRRRLRARAMVASVRRLRPQLVALDAQGLVAYRLQLRRDLVAEGLIDPVVARAFALVRETARRILGMEHYDVQIEGGLAILDGAIAELDTGEGKTLTATLAVATAALAGIPVHLITVNDYLAERDAQLMTPLYEALGLSLGVVLAGLDPSQRRTAYAADITYCSNKEIAFDYLRDRMTLGNTSSNLRRKLGRLQPTAANDSGTVLRGLYFAIVDEADSVLIDEARTPLIISGRSDPEAERQRAEQALGVAAELEPGRDFILQTANGRIDLTTAGCGRIEARGALLGGAWCGRLYREQQARTALSALHLLRRDEHYLVRDDKVQIIDENTGRLMPDRSWGEGLHQIVECKEGCTVTGQSVPLARMTFQRFFRRYQRLAGMTGSARESAGECWSVYRLPVQRIATNRPVARQVVGPRVLRTADNKWHAIVERTAALVAEDRPVLIGTRSVAASETISGYLQQAGISHNVLNAAQDAHEAEVIAEAGRPGQVTVATNMAGRGVDIRLEPFVLERGGLHVIVSERHDSARIDRQLYGRCGRQGEPGRVEVILSLEDALVADPPVWARRLLAGIGGARWMFARAQQRRERQHACMRRDLLRWDERMGDALAFSGEPE